MNAALNGHYASARLLLNAGADSSIQNKHGENALAIARKTQCPEIIALLEDHERLRAAQQRIKPALREQAIPVEVNSNFRASAILAECSLVLKAAQHDQEAGTRRLTLLAVESEQSSDSPSIRFQYWAHAIVAFDKDVAGTDPGESRIYQEENESTQLRASESSSELSLQQMKRSEAPIPALDLCLTDLDFDQRE
eukprot:m.175700 g.175700  ORF g.175700 m.175700 type:complete len:195 (+) comp53325_c0_seq8:364-948(+)